MNQVDKTWRHKEQETERDRVMQSQAGKDRDRDTEATRQRRPEQEARWRVQKGMRLGEPLPCTREMAFQCLPSLES